MSKGYFCIAQGEKYVKYAYALALSLKTSQSTINKLSIGITPGQLIDANMVDAFDQIIEIPWGDLAASDDWKLKNEWKTVFMSPYDETIKLDADMLFFDDISSWWKEFETSDLVFAENALTYREEIITSDFCRKLFTLNELPNLYSAFFYFKKTTPVYEFFKLSEIMFENWKSFAETFLEAKHRPEDPSTDVVYALAYKLLNAKELNNCLIDNFPIFTHMKTVLQNWKFAEEFDENWTKHIQFHFTPECSLRIGNFAQRMPFHYHNKEFVTEQMIMYFKEKLKNV